MSHKVQLANDLREAFAVVRSHKLRSTLVVLGVAIGVAAIMGMVSIIVGLNAKIERDFRSSDNIVVRLARFGIVVHGDPEIFKRPEVTPQDWRAIREQVPSVRMAEFLEADMDNNAYEVRHGDQKANRIQVFGTASNFARIYRIPLVAGRMLTEEDVVHGRRVCILGFGPLTDLFPLTDPVGKSVRIGENQYTVVGAFAERDTLFGKFAENFAVIPYTAFRKDFARRELVFSAIDMVPVEGVGAEQLMDDVRAFLRARRKLLPSQADDFELLSQDQVQELIKKVTGPVGLVLAVIASVGLMVGGIGVMAIMLVSVTERTKEIGVRMALGARRRDVLWQFLIEAASLTGSGGLIGIVTGLGLAALIELLVSVPAAAPLSYVMLAFGVSVAIGLIFGLYPAVRAARLDPVEAMRAE